jgi:hypothetical protein
VVFTGRHRFLLLGAVTMLLPFVVNAAVEVPLGHRFILLVIPFLQMGLVWMLLKATPGFHEGWWRLRGPPWVRHLSVLGVAAALGAMVMVNVEKADAITHSWRGTRRSVIRRCRGVADVAGPGAVVMADPLASWSLPACGVKVLALQHPNPLVADQRVRSAWCSGSSIRRLERGAGADPRAVPRHARPDPREDPAGGRRVPALARRPHDLSRATCSTPCAAERGAPEGVADSGHAGPIRSRSSG